MSKITEVANDHRVYVRDKILLTDFTMIKYVKEKYLSTWQIFKNIFKHFANFLDVKSQNSRFNKFHWTHRSHKLFI